MKKIKCCLYGPTVSATTLITTTLGIMTFCLTIKKLEKKHKFMLCVKIKSVMFSVSMISVVMLNVVEPSSLLMYYAGASTVTNIYCR